MNKCKVCHDDLNPKSICGGCDNRAFKKSKVQFKEDEKLRNIICVDIDGTIAQCGDRDIYDGSKVYLDKVIDPVADVVRKYLVEDKVVYLSGRDEEHRGVTEKWLADNGLWGGKLIMRPNRDKRCDTIVKKELYETHIKGKYNVLFVIDDRPKVCRMWRELGLFLFNVGDPYTEF